MLRDIDRFTSILLEEQAISILITHEDELMEKNYRI